MSRQTWKIQAGETIVFGYFSQEPLRVADDKRVIDVGERHR